MLQLLALALSLSYAHCFPSVSLSHGTYTGLFLPPSPSIPHSQDLFLGIPFARPPLASLRFRPPQILEPGNGTHEATSYGQSCPQYGPFAVGVIMGEDCLTLNVVRPATSELEKLGAGKDEKLPVLVWIYGGGFAAGATSDPRYNLSYIVSTSVASSQPIIAVSINYRTAAFGFLASSEVMSSGNSNIGLLDQRFALEWLQENIGAFRGDRTKITIFGESAGETSAESAVFTSFLAYKLSNTKGAYAIGQQLLAYGGDREVPFRAAIMQSGTALSGYQNVSFYQPLYDKLVSSVNCSFAADTLDCLRSVPYDILYLFTVNVGFNPVIDGDFLRGLPSTEMRGGKWAKVPLLLGTNTDEGTASFFGPNGINSTSELATWLLNATSLALTETTVSALLPLYPSSLLLGAPYGTGASIPQPLSTFGTQYKRSASLAGDIFIISGRRFTAELNAARGLSTYSYRFDAVPWELPAFITNVPNSVTHYSEIPFVFSNLQNLNASANWIGPYDSYRRLSTLMTRSWISFTVHLDPNYHGVARVPTWLDYGNTDRPTNFVFAPDRSMMEVDDFRKHGIATINAASVEFLR